MSKRFQSRTAGYRIYKVMHELILTVSKYPIGEGTSALDESYTAIIFSLIPLLDARKPYRSK